MLFRPAAACLAFALAPSGAWAEAHCATTLAEAANSSGGFCHGSTRPTDLGAAPPPAVSPGMQDLSNAAAGAFGSAVGGALVAPLAPVKGRYGTLKGHQFDEKVDDGSDSANSAGVKAAQDILNDYSEGSKPRAQATSCPDDAICLGGSTPSFAALGEQETPPHSRKASTLTDDGEGLARAHRGVGDVPDFLDRSASEAAASRTAGWDTTESITKYATLTANGVKAFFPDALADGTVSKLDFGAGLIKGGVIAGRVITGDVDGAGKSATWLVIGKANAWVLGQAGEPHKFVAQVITGAEKKAEDSISKAASGYAGEPDVSNFYPTSGSE